MSLQKIGGGVIVEAEGPMGDPEPTSGWNNVAPLGTGRYDIAAATDADGQIYAIGGDSSSGDFMSLVEQYDPSTDTWSTVASLGTGRQRLAAASDGDGRVYAIGGEASANDERAVVERYDSSTDTWNEVASMGTERKYFGAATDANGRIYVMGGESQDGFESSVEQYDPSTDTWSTVASLSTVRTDLTAASDGDGLLYAIGGGTSSAIFESLVEQYDPSTDTWTTVASLGSAREYLAAASDGDGFVYAIGGDLGSGTTEINEEVPIVEQYNPATNTWSEIASLRAGRNSLAAATDTNGRVYAIGGESTANEFAPSVERLTFTPTFVDVYSATGNTLFGIDDPNGILLNRTTGREVTGGTQLARDGETIAAVTETNARIYRTEET